MWLAVARPHANCKHTFGRVYVERFFGVRIRVPCVPRIGGLDNIKEEKDLHGRAGIHAKMAPCSPGIGKRT